MRIEELLQCDLNNPQHADLLKELKISAREIAILMDGIAKSEISALKKAGYYKYLRSVKPTSEVRYEKFSAQIREALDSKNFNALLNLFSYYTQHARKKDFAELRQNFKDRQFALQFYGVLFGGYCADRSMYFDQTRKGRIKEIARFLDSQKIPTPQQEEIEQIILASADLASGLRAMKFFIDSGVRKNFSRNFIVNFLAGLKEAGGLGRDILADFDRDELELLPIFYEEKFDQNVLKKFLNSCDLFEEFKLLSFLAPDEKSHNLIKKLLTEIAFEEKNPQRLSAICSMLRLAPFALNHDEIKDLLRRVREERPEIFVEMIEGFFWTISRNFKDFNLDREQLTSLIDQAIAERSMANLSTLVSLFVEQNFAKGKGDEKDKKEFIQNIFKKMMDANFLAQDDEETFSPKDFINIWSKFSHHKLDRNFVFGMIDSFAKLSLRHPDSNIFSNLSGSLYALFCRMDEAPLQREAVVNLVKSVIFYEEKDDELVIGRGNSIARMGSEIMRAILGFETRDYENSVTRFSPPIFSRSEFKEIYFAEMVNLIAMKSDDPQFRASRISLHEGASDFTLTELVDIALEAARRSNNKPRAFGITLDILNANRRAHIAESNNVSLSQIYEFINLAVQTNSSQQQKTFAILSELCISPEEFIDESSDKKLLLIFEKLASLKLNTEDERYTIFRNFYRNAFAGQAEKAKKRLLAKMNPALRYLYNGYTALEITQENYFEILVKCCSFSGEAGRIVFDEIVNFLEKNPSQNSAQTAQPSADNSPADIDTATLVSILKFASRARIKSAKLKVVLPTFLDKKDEVGSCDEWGEFLKESASEFEKFDDLAQAIILLNELEIDCLFLPKIIEEMKMKDVLAIIILTAKKHGNRNGVFTAFMPKIKAQMQKDGAYSLFVILNEIRDGDGRGALENEKKLFWMAIAPYIKIRANDEVFWDSFWHNSRMSDTDCVSFILQTYSEDSATSSTALRTPLIIEGRVVDNMEKVAAMFRFFPHLINQPRYIDVLAADDDLIKALNSSLKFYAAKLMNRDQFAALKALHDKRAQLFPRSENIDLRQLISCKDFLAEKEKFKKNKELDVLKDSNLGQALQGLQHDKSFEKFYEALLPENRQALGLRKVEESEGRLRAWFEEVAPQMQNRFDELSKMNLQNFVNPETKKLFQERQALRRFIEDYKKTEISAFEQFCAIKKFAGEIPADLEKLSKSSADIQNYQAMLKNEAPNEYGGCWHKFCANLENNLQLLSFMTDEKELAASLSAQLQLVQQPECRVNLQAAQEREIERRRYGSPNCAALAMGFFQGILPLVTANVHNYDPEIIGGVHLPRNSLCQMAGSELLDIVEKYTQLELQKHLSRQQVELVDNLDRMKFITSLSGSFEEEEVKIKTRSGEVVLSGENCRQIHNRNLKQFLQREKPSEELPADLTSFHEEFNAFLDEQRTKIITALGIEACKLELSREFNSRNLRDLSTDLSLHPLDVTIPASARRLSRQETIAPDMIH